MEARHQRIADSSVAGSVLSDGVGGGGPKFLGLDRKSVSPIAPKARARIEELRLRYLFTAMKSMGSHKKKRPRVEAPAKSSEILINGPIRSSLPGLPGLYGPSCGG